MSIDLARIERVSQALTAAMEAGNTLPYSLAMALEVAGLLASPETAAQRAAVLALHRRHDDSDHCFADDEVWPCQTRVLLDPAPRRDLRPGADAAWRMIRASVEDLHESPLHTDYATPHDLPEVPGQRDRRAGL